MEPGNVRGDHLQLAERRDDPPFPYEWLDPDRDHVLVTVGTLNTDIAGDFYTRMLRAVSEIIGAGVLIS